MDRPDAFSVNGRPFDRAIFVAVTAALSITAAVATRAVLAVDLTGDALGNGLTLMLLYGLLGSTGGCLEGWRRVPLSWTSIRWLAVSLAASVATGAFNGWLASVDGISSLLGVTVFLAVLLCGGATLGSLLCRYVLDQLSRGR